MAEAGARAVTVPAPVPMVLTLVMETLFMVVAPALATLTVMVTDPPTVMAVGLTRAKLAAI